MSLFQVYRSMLDSMPAYIGYNTTLHFVLHAHTLQPLLLLLQLPFRMFQHRYCKVTSELFMWSACNLLSCRYTFSLKIPAIFSFLFWEHQKNFQIPKVLKMLYLCHRFIWICEISRDSYIICIVHECISYLFIFGRGLYVAITYVPEESDGSEQ